MATISKLSPNQELAKKILKIIETCEIGGTDGDGKTVLSLYPHPDYEKLVYGPNSETLSEAEKDKSFNEYQDAYERDWLQAENEDKWHQKFPYLKAKLKGIIEGRITTGDSELGTILYDFSSKMNSLIEEDGLPYSSEIMKRELANLYVKTFAELNELVLEGATQGLFTSGHPIAAERKLSAAERYRPER